MAVINLYETQKTGGNLLAAAGHILVLSSRLRSASDPCLVTRDWAGTDRDWAGFAAGDATAVGTDRGLA
jgi:hypothetical protein